MHEIYQCFALIKPLAGLTCQSLAVVASMKMRTSLFLEVYGLMR